MKKKNWFLVIIIIIAVLLIATVIWIYSKRIEDIENKMKGSSTSTRAKRVVHRGRQHGPNDSASFSSYYLKTIK